MESYVSIFFFLILVVAIIGFIGNIIVIIVYVFDQKLRSFTTYFFVNLSVVDLLIVLLCLPVGLLDMLNNGQWILGKFVCHGQFFIESIFISVSSLTFISISLERLFAIKRPFQIKKLVNKKFTLCTIFGVWITSIVFSFPMYYITSYTEETMNNETIIYCYMDRTILWPKLYVATFTSLFLVAPTLILTFVYTTIIRKLKRLNDIFMKKSTSRMSFQKQRRVDSDCFDNYQLKNGSNSGIGGLRKNFSASRVNRLVSSEKNSVDNNNNNSNNNRLEFQVLKKANRSDSDNVSNYEEMEEFRNPNAFCSRNLIAKRKQTITLCLISIAFFFCQMPIKMFQIFNSFYEFEPETPEKDLIRFKILNIIFYLTKLIYCLHGMSNPIIYNLMSSKFNRSFRNVILCKSLNNYQQTYQKSNHYLNNHNHIHNYHNNNYTPPHNYYRHHLVAGSANHYQNNNNNNNNHLKVNTNHRTNRLTNINYI